MGIISLSSLYLGVRKPGETTLEASKRILNKKKKTLKLLRTKPPKKTRPRRSPPIRLPRVTLSTKNIRTAAKKGLGGQ